MLIGSDKGIYKQRGHPDPITDQLCYSGYAELEYFPSCETLMEELRDYRFYAEDMIHPGDTSVIYIWDRFCDTCVKKSTQKLILLSSGEFYPYVSCFPLPAGKFEHTGMLFLLTGGIALHISMFFLPAGGNALHICIPFLPTARIVLIYECPSCRQE